MEDEEEDEELVSELKLETEPVLLWTSNFLFCDCGPKDSAKDPQFMA